VLYLWCCGYKYIGNMNQNGEMFWMLLVLYPSLWNCVILRKCIFPDDVPGLESSLSIAKLVAILWSYTQCKKKRTNFIVVLKYIKTNTCVNNWFHWSQMICSRYYSCKKARFIIDFLSVAPQPLQNTFSVRMMITWCVSILIHILSYSTGPY